LAPLFGTEMKILTNKYFILSLVFLIFFLVLSRDNSIAFDKKKWQHHVNKIKHSKYEESFFEDGSNYILTGMSNWLINENILIGFDIQKIKIKLGKINGTDCDLEFSDCTVYYVIDESYFDPIILELHFDNTSLINKVVIRGT